MIALVSVQLNTWSKATATTGIYFFTGMSRTNGLPHCQLCLKLSTEGDMQAFGGSPSASCRVSCPHLNVADTGCGLRPHGEVSPPEGIKGSEACTGA